jgi:hypothetical protein
MVRSCVPTVHLRRLTRLDEGSIKRIILDNLPEHPIDGTISWSELWSRVSKSRGQKIRSKQTFAKYLKELVEDGWVIERGKEYTISATMRIWTQRMRGPRLTRNRKTIEDREAFLETLAMQFNYVLVSYVEMLDGLMEIEDDYKAREHVDSFFEIIPPENQLKLFATEVWRNRKKLPLKAIEKDGVLIVSLKPDPIPPPELWSEPPAAEGL